MVPKSIGDERDAICGTKIQAIGFLAVTENLLLEADNCCNRSVHSLSHFVGGIDFLEQ